MPTLSEKYSKGSGQTLSERYGGSRKSRIAATMNRLDAPEDRNLDPSQTSWTQSLQAGAQKQLAPKPLPVKKQAPVKKAPTQWTQDLAGQAGPIEPKYTRLPDYQGGQVRHFDAQNQEMFRDSTGWTYRPPIQAPAEDSSKNQLLQLLFMGAPVGKAATAGFAAATKGSKLLGKVGKAAQKVQAVGEGLANVPGAKGAIGRGAYRAVTGAAENVALNPLYGMDTLVNQGVGPFLQEQVQSAPQQALIGGAMKAGFGLLTEGVRPRQPEPLPVVKKPGVGEKTIPQLQEYSPSARMTGKDKLRSEKVRRLSELYRLRDEGATKVQIGKAALGIETAIKRTQSTMDVESVSAATPEPTPVTPGVTPPVTGEPGKITNPIIDSLSKREAEIKARMAERQKEAMQAPTEVGRAKKGQRGAVINPWDDIIDYAELGAIKIARGTVKFADWSIEMVREFGEAVEPHLKRIWVQSQKYNRDNLIPFKKDLVDFGGEADPRFKLMQALKSAKKSDPTKDIVFAQQRSQRYGKLAGAIDNPKLSASESLKAGLGALKGEFERPDFEIPNFSKADLDELMQMARDTDVLHSHYDKLNVMRSVLELVEQGKQPQPAVYGKIAKVYGPEFAKRLMNKDTSLLVRIARRTWVESGGLSRSLQTGFDNSWNLIQGWRMAFMEPRQWGKGLIASTKALFSEEATVAMDKAIREHPDYDLFSEAGLYLPERGDAVHPSHREDAFVTRTLQKIPGIGRLWKGAERAFITGGNVNRMGLAAKYAKLQRELNARKSGKEGYLTMQEAREWAKYTNVMSSRGNLYKLERAADVIGAPFYSLRNLAAQIEHPFYIMHPNKAIRKTAIRHWVQYAGLTTAILTTAKLAGHDVEEDNTSSDYGKIKVGNRRIDMLGGYGPMVRLVTRSYYGKYKTTTGKTMPTKSTTELGQFARYKVAPNIGMVWNAFAGEDPIGQPYDTEHWANILDDFIPMVAGDVYDAGQLDGWDKGAWVAPYIFLGGRVQTYDANKPREGAKQRGFRPPTHQSIYKSIVPNITP